jgi:HEAT repeat protein
LSFVGELAAVVDHYLGEWDSSRWAGAYHRLVELGPVIVPGLREHFWDSRDPAFREALVDIATQLHSADALPLFEEALQDNTPGVWKRALDGLVDLASAEAIALLQQSLEGTAPAGMGPGEREAWLREALQQASEAQRARANLGA